MTEALLVIFLFQLFVNVLLTIIRGWKNQTEYFFVYVNDKYRDRSILVSAIIIFLIVIGSVIFKKSIIIIILLFLIVVSFGYALYLDYKKKLKSLLSKYI